MERCDDPAEASRWCARTRATGRTLGFVPTMGALHDGHLELVRRAVRENDAACVSVFVNPLQFNDKTDLERYPRDFDGDARALAALGCAMAFTGTLEGFFPGALDARGELPPSALLDPGPGARGLEGDLRPGHFEGVATIVDRLFALVAPDRAYFGLKDFQQTLVVRDVAARRGGPEIVVCPTVREPSGLARSSRNQLLDEAARREATAIHEALRAAHRAWQEGTRTAAELAEVMRAELAPTSLAVEYAEVRDPERWSRGRPEGTLARAVALVAARAGGVRLIDNAVISEGDAGL